MGTITVSNLGKAYKKYPNRWSRLIEWILPINKPRHSLKWVMNDVTFKVNPGEAVGIIGINGAGKSTLLKMIVGTTRPTVGSVEITGKVAALLELGMGFHPDFTGRQNAFMAAQLLGNSVEVIAKLMPQIEDFAEIGDYIDQPVRVYSSGMQMRLAFSVATALRPDILIVDEALSVGDTYFQHKSFERIREFRKKGTTLLIVSHDKSAIQSICDRAILLNSGTIAMEGEPETIMNYYNALIASKSKKEIQLLNADLGKKNVLSGNGSAVIQKVSINDALDKEIELIKVGQKIIIKLDVLVNENIADLVAGIMIKDRLGETLYGTNTFHLKKVIENLKCNDRIQINFALFANLGEGSYSISVALHSGQDHLSSNYFWQDRAIVFNVINIGLNKFVGSSWLKTDVEVNYG